MSTFVYWICATEEIELAADINSLASAMSTQCDTEEQVHDPSGFEHLHDYSPSPLRPLAPVTFCDRWSPFPDVRRGLGNPLYARFTADDHRAIAYAVWRPKWLGELSAGGGFTDCSHLTFLLRLTSAKAARLGCNLFVMGQIGWTYDPNDTPTNPENALAMLSYGYVFTDRYAR